MTWTDAPALRADPPQSSRLAEGKLRELRAERLDARFKAFPEAELTIGEVGTAGWHLRDLMLPVVTLRESALEHNLNRMAAWCAEHGASLAPHGKTTMAPQLFDRQLAAGAWGITAATMSQVRLMRAFGVPRVLLANEVVSPVALRWLARELNRDPGFDFYCLVDSVDGVERMETVLQEIATARPLQVLVELGIPGQRTGLREPAAVAALAKRVAASSHLVLAGSEGYEGVLPQSRKSQDLAPVDVFLVQLAHLVTDLDAANLFDGRSEIIATAGGSAYFDRVMTAFDSIGPTSVPVRPVLRSGGYLTHDHLSYERSSPLRAGAAAPTDALRPALELWAEVVSVPEPGLAIVGFGKRDAPYDLDLPVPLARQRGMGEPVSLPSGTDVARLNDQHAYIRHNADLRVADVIRLGLSHPCTAFDKWPLLPVLDDSDHVVGAVRTFF